MPTGRKRGKSPDALCLAAPPQLTLRGLLGPTHAQHGPVSGHEVPSAADRIHRTAGLYDKIKIADAVNAKVISLDDAPKGYVNFDGGESVKYVIDPHGVTGMAQSL